jgi:orotidine-5'-phosphate decarboxylase
MGIDSVEPFLEFKDKLVFVLALTSNVGSADFQRLDCGGKPLFMHVIEKSRSWADDANIGFVVGATHPDDLTGIRKIASSNALLIPGVGTQGGDAKSILAANGNAPAIVNVSRAIIFAGDGADYPDKVREKAKHYYELLKK